MTPHPTALPGGSGAMSSLDLREPICGMMGSTPSSVPCTEWALSHFTLPVPSYHMRGIVVVIPILLMKTRKFEELK